MFIDTGPKALEPVSLTVLVSTEDGVVAIVLGSCVSLNSFSGVSIAVLSSRGSTTVDSLSSEVADSAESDCPKSFRCAEPKPASLGDMERFVSIHGMLISDGESVDSADGGALSSSSEGSAVERSETSESCCGDMLAEELSVPSDVPIDAGIIHGIISFVGLPWAVAHAGEIVASGAGAEAIIEVGISVGEVCVVTLMVDTGMEKEGDCAL